MVTAREFFLSGTPPRAPAFLEQEGAAGEGEAISSSTDLLIRAFAHEIRSPLTAIRLYSSSALRLPRLKAQQVIELLEWIESSARLVEVIVNDLESISSNRTINLEPKVLELSSYLIDLAPEFCAIAPGRLVEIVNVPDLRMRADPFRLKQVLTNLVRNAHKYSRPGGAIIVHAEQQDRDVLIAVDDEGPGVPERDLERIFEPFYRSCAESEVGGSGLGLAICRALVEVQGGRLEAVLQPGGAFRLLMRLPASQHDLGVSSLTSEFLQAVGD